MHLLALIQLYLLIPYIILLYWTDWILDYTCWWRCDDDNDVVGEEVLRLCSGWVALPKLLPSAINSDIPSQPLDPLIAMNWSNPRLGMLLALLYLFDDNDVGGEEVLRFGLIECFVLLHSVFCVLAVFWGFSLSGGWHLSSAAPRITLINYLLFNLFCYFIYSTIIMNIEQCIQANDDKNL